MTADLSTLCAVASRRIVEARSKLAELERQLADEALLSLQHSARSSERYDVIRHRITAQHRTIEQAQLGLFEAARINQMGE